MFAFCSGARWIIVDYFNQACTAEIIDIGLVMLLVWILTSDCFKKFTSHLCSCSVP